MSILSVELVANKVICRDRRKQTSHPTQRHLETLSQVHVTNSSQPGTTRGQTQVIQGTIEVTQGRFPTQGCHRGLHLRKMGILPSLPALPCPAMQSVMIHVPAPPAYIVHLSCTQESVPSIHSCWGIRYAAMQYGC